MTDEADRNLMPAMFVEQVKDALDHLYDLPHLQQHPLAAAGGSEPAGPRLRRELADAIDRLGNYPEADHSPHARLAQLLRLHYLEGLTVQDAALELDLSVRQAFRDLRRAEENLAALLWPSHAPAASGRSAEQATSFAAEIDRLESHATTLDAAALVNGAVQAVARLAEQRGLRLRMDAPTAPVPVCGDAALARQLLIHIFSQVIQQSEPGELHARLTGGAAPSRLSITCPSDNIMLGDLATQLASRVGWSFAPTGGLVLCMGRPGARLLIVDDNEGLVDLLERYLTGESCQVSATYSSREGLRLAEETRPDAIILDIMMPEMDGWEFLQRLRANSRTAAIPALVCSVLSDPELAHSLGATRCLRKPIEREPFVDALRGLRLL
jgi:CheY-like chemotaxis protein